MVYPLEIEFTNFCSLSCKMCINKNFSKKGYLSFNNYIAILDYINKNRDTISYVNFSGIGDIFMHPEIIYFLEIFIDKFKGTNIKVLIPTKGQLVYKEHLLLLKKMQYSKIHININVGFYSFLKDIHDDLAGKKSFSKMISFLLKLKNYKLPFSIELISGKKEEEYYLLKKYVSYFGCGYSHQKYHNFAGRIKGGDFGFNICNFNKEDYKFSDSICSFIPFVDFSGSVYPCSISSGKDDFIIGNIELLFKKYSNYIDLVDYIKNIINKEKCIDCSILKYYGKNKK